eukprot:CAMPEP_0197638572 /NCGR_PEP_ID=MMETSP1338-20131121/13461_1 /TAXON_ID=43686 ORGANISM="Pelagodinium beii, Strain RCC1491" /NCGR_SAMPLE_ID=MMETSP1338 /ASSEMBLY_ACC=CAM_ASM_000754 /LENGTH=697 /DNA_ID=CAMNT_0043211171 /DNA_START=52 /DNA_END=2145 /DNA_ORIENTATION=+
MRRVSRAESIAAAKRIAGKVTRTPLVKLNWTRPDAPDLEIYLKLENLQPVSSFKVRGAVNVIQARLAAGKSSDVQNMHVVTCSAGNMGQGVAYAAVSVGCKKCTIIVPDSAPQAKLSAMERWNSPKTEVCIIKVPYERWWNIVLTSDVTKEMGSEPTTFIHPVVDQDNMTGHSTMGLEIEQDLPEVEACYVAWGGGGCCSGIASILCESGAKMFSCEPETANPIAVSWPKKEITAPDYRPSFVDGCGGKTVLPAMWPLAQELLTGAETVGLTEIEIAIATLLRRNRTVAEGAGACAVAAAMFGEGAKKFKKVVCVVCGGCLDSSKLVEFLGKHGEEAATERIASIESPQKKQKLADGHDHRTLASAFGGAKIFSAQDVKRFLPMEQCIGSTAEALKALSSGAGFMPVRAVTKLPLPDKKLGFVASMPSYFEGYCGCKLITVFPGNQAPLSSHQGLVMLCSGEDGRILSLSDAHKVTMIRTAASSAVATNLLALKRPGMTLAILGTGHQAESHFEAMLAVRSDFITQVNLWGRSQVKVEKLRHVCEELLSKRTSQRAVSFKLFVEPSAQHAVADADIVCTVTSATSPILCGAWLKSGAHVNAVGACTPAFSEFDATCLEKSRCFCDTREACLREPGDILGPIGEGSIAAEKVFEAEIGEVLEKGIHRSDEDITFYKAVGIALADLTAARLITSNLSKA